MSWKKLLIPATAIPIVALLAYGLTRDPNKIESPLPGREAFDFSSETLDGDTIRLADLKGSVVVMNFWASWCVACIEEHTYFVEAERFYADNDFQMLGVVYQDTPENARRWMRMRGGDWPSLIDPNSRIAIDYGVYGVPETYFIDKAGRITFKQIGPVSRALLRQKVDSLLALPATGGLTATDGSALAKPAGESPGHVRGIPAEEPERPTSGGQP